MGRLRGSCTRRVRASSAVTNGRARCRAGNSSQCNRTARMQAVQRTYAKKQSMRPRKSETADGARMLVASGWHTALRWRNAMARPQPDCSPLEPEPLGTGDRHLPSREGVRIAGAARCPAAGRHGGMAVGWTVAGNLNVRRALFTPEPPGTSVTWQHARTVSIELPDRPKICSHSRFFAWEIWSTDHRRQEAAQARL